MRSLRRNKAENFYHIVLRAHRREALFSTPEDRRALNRISIETLRIFDARLHGYCLLPNQFRALVQIKDKHLGDALRRIATRYSQHRYGDAREAKLVFERPHAAQRIESDAEFRRLLRSIHLSPVLTHQVTSPADYKWSSHRAYLGYKSVAWITTDFGLSLFADDPTKARIVYQQFTSEGMGANVCEDAPAERLTNEIRMPRANPKLGQDACSFEHSDRIQRTPSSLRYLSIY